MWRSKQEMRFPRESRHRPGSRLGAGEGKLSCLRVGGNSRQSTGLKAAHRVIDSGRSIAEVARELPVKEVSLGKWVRDERAGAEASRGTDLEPLSLAERFELQRLRKKVIELKKDNSFLGKSSAYFAANPPRRSDSR